VGAIDLNRPADSMTATYLLTRAGLGEPRRPKSATANSSDRRNANRNGCGYDNTDEPDLSFTTGHCARIWDNRESGEAGVLRLRHRYREEIAYTVIFPGDIEE